MRFRPRVYLEILAAMFARFRALSDTSPPFREGDVLTSTFEVAALEDDESNANMVRLVRGRSLDDADDDELARRGREFGLTREQPVSATVANLYALRDLVAAPAGAVTLAAASTVMVPPTSTQSAVEYETDALLTIPATVLNEPGGILAGVGSFVVAVAPGALRVPSRVWLGPAATAEELTVTGISGTTITLLNPTADPHADVEAVAFEASAYGTATATEPGLDGNAAVGTITTLRTPVAGVAGVSNDLAGSGGADLEDLEDFRARIRAHPDSILGASNTSVELEALNGVFPPQRVLKSRAVHDYANDRLRVYIDDGSSVAATIGPVTSLGPGESWVYTATGGELQLRVTQMAVAGGAPDPNFPLIRPAADPDPNGPASQPFTVASSVVGAMTLSSDYYLDEMRGLLAFHDPGPNVPRALDAGEVITVSAASYVGGLVAETQRIIVGMHPEDVASFPGIVEGTARVRVQPITATLSVPVTATMLVDPGYDGVAARAEAQTRISAYLQGLGIGAPAYLAEMIELAMGVPGAQNFTITAPAADQQPVQSGIVAPGAVTIS